MAKRLWWTTAALAAVAVTGWSAPAFAQQSGEEPRADSGDDVIVVTARKKEETILDAPVAVTALGGEDFKKLNIGTVDDVAKFTPGLVFSQAFGRSTDRPVIRGQSNVLANVQFGVESGTAYFVDGLYYPNTAQNIDFSEIQRVEVIKGPQSALYGRNTYAGAINFITKGGADKPEASARIRAASHGETELNASVAGPIIPGVLTGRVSVRGYNYDGEFTNRVTQQTVGQESTQSGSVVLDFTPTDNFSVRLRHQITADDDGPLAIFFQPAAANNCRPGLRSLAAWPAAATANPYQYYCGVIRPQPVALNTGPDADGVPNLVPGVPVTAAFPGTTVYNVTDPGVAFNGIERDLKFTSLQFDWDVWNGYSLSYDIGYRTEVERQGFDSDHSSVNLFNPGFTGPAATGESWFANTGRDDTRDASHEIRFSSPANQRFSWMVGYFYFQQENKGTDLTKAFPLGGGPRLDRNWLYNRAVFGLVDFDITDRLSITLEGRSQAESRKSANFAAATGAVPTYFRSVKYDKFTPRVTVSYDLGDSFNLYGVYAEGVKPGGLNGTAGLSVNRPTYDQEESKNYEIGLKGAMFDGRLTFSTAAYFTQATGVQLTTAILSPTNALTSIVTNQGDGEIKGFEVESNLRLTENWALRGAYTYSNPEFTKGCDEDQWTLTSGGGRLVTATGTGAGSSYVGTTIAGVTVAGPATCSIVGNQYPLTSKHSGSAAIEYRRPVFGGNWDLYGTANVSYESSKFVQVHNLAETGAATMAGLRFGFESDNLDFSVVGKNINDEDSIVLATRWLQTNYQTFFAANTAPSTGWGTATPIAGAGAGPGASRSAPRGYFGTLRKGPSWGVEARLKF
jgi:iron complex outermembrane receptor protein